MFTGAVTLPGLQARVFHAEGSGHANQDRWLAQPHGSDLRVAAVDGVTPWRAPYYPGGDAAQWAAATTIGALALPLDLAEALMYANTLTHDPALAPSRRQAMAAAAVADCQRAGDLVGWSGVVSGDCEIWVADSREAVPRLVLGGELLRPEAQRDWEAQLAEHSASWSADERSAAKAALLDDPSVYVCHAVGRFPAPVFDQAAGMDSVVVLASDGARMYEAVQHGVVIRDLTDWLKDVVRRPVRDDITCLIIEVWE
jgi:hypothetical protein